MLVLSRRQGEEIVIGDRVRVRVARVKGKRVVLAVAAPDHVSVHREEIHRRRRDLVMGGPLVVATIKQPVKQPR